MVTQQMFLEDKWFEVTDERIKQFAATVPKNWSNTKFVEECERNLRLTLSDPIAFCGIYSKFRKKRSNKIYK